MIISEQKTIIPVGSDLFISFIYRFLKFTVYSGSKV